MNISNDSASEATNYEVFGDFDFETMRIAFSILYLSLCVFGLTGNLWVISIVIYIFRTLKASAVTQKHMYIYVLR